ncbi:MAG: A/G-specific adenine glycosylase [Planctomycetes bacterium]|nr:A/G-specific adenine glycosylase [Planctomycetota bacterium]
MNTRDVASIRRRLLAWFRKNARPLPWRATRDPYRIWISEVMLQQTQVAAVIPYFKRFLKHFPTLPKLAQADEQMVLRLWEGLGYYRRARDLCRAARLLRNNKYRTIPDDPEVVRTLPGFGRYTTNAVLSQAYDRRLPIVEANSRRVLCRLFGIERLPRDAELWQLAESLLPQRSVGDFNQAMMELGALVCTATNPHCESCPIAVHCRGRRMGRQDHIPVRAPSAEVCLVDEVAVIVQRDDRLLIVQRPDAGRWARMWEFPHHVRAPGESVLDSVQRLLTSLGLEGTVGDEIATIRHRVTRFQITMVCVQVHHPRGSAQAGTYANLTWVRPQDLHAYPLSTPQRRLARRLHADD